jgi:transcription elongation factor GreA
MVGEWEADPANKKISPESPLGKRLFGKKVGEKIEVEAPAGKVEYEILAIE